MINNNLPYTYAVHLDYSELRGAIARAYTREVNKNKELDSDLINSIVEEIVMINCDHKFFVFNEYLLYCKNCGGVRHFHFAEKI